MFKATMYTSIGCSMYMMGRLVLVRSLLINACGITLIDTSGTQDLVRQELDSGHKWSDTQDSHQRQNIWQHQCTNNNYLHLSTFPYVKPE